MAGSVLQWIAQGEGGTPTVGNRVLRALLTACGLNPDAIFTGLAPVFNVKAYGAVGNGVTNDSAAIQAAHDAANLAGGGMVYFPWTLLGYNVGTTINVSGTGISFGGPGRIVCTTDVKVYLVTGTDITFDRPRIDGQQVAVGSQNVLISIEGGTDVHIFRPRLLNSRFYGIYMNGATNVVVDRPYIYRSADHGIYLRDVCTNIEINGGRIVSPGFGNPGTAAGKGIGVQGIGGLCSYIRINGVQVENANQIGIELFGNSGLAPGVQFATISNCIVTSSLASNGNRFAISLDATQDATVTGCVVNGCDMGFEIAGGCKRVTYNACVSKGSKSDGVQVSNNSGVAANDPEQVTLSNIIVKGAANHGIEVLRATSVVINNPQVDGATLRGIFVNDPGNNGANTSTAVRINGGVVRNCGTTGVYMLTHSDTVWSLKDVVSTGNNTAIAANEDPGFYVNASTQANNDTIHLSGLVGTINRPPGASLDQQANGLLVAGGFKKFTAAVTNASTGFNHGLGYTPSKVIVVPTGNVIVWRSAGSSSTQVFLQASAAGPTNVDVYVA